MDDEPPLPLDYRTPQVERPRDRQRRRDAREDSGCLATILLVAFAPVWMCLIAPIILGLSQATSWPLIASVVFAPIEVVAMLWICLRLMR